MAQIKRRVMLVEDSKPNRALISSLLRNLGFEVIEVTNSKDAIQIWKTDGQNLDLVMSDTILEDVSVSKTCRFYLITSLQERNRTTQKLEIKLDGVLFMPVTAQRLLGGLREHFPDLEYQKITA